VADPARSFATVRGSFTVKSKHVTATMTGSQQADDYELADVPYVQYFQEGYALHGTFWHDNFGRTQSHGCVNLTPADSAWVFEFTDPPVPEHWHGVVGHENTPRSVVHVRP
jgi:lipoprotein-anchoring transpeptidase ErfK/SrfK